MVDQAQQAATVSKSQVLSARHSLDLVNQKNTADLQAANDGVSLAQQGVETARSGLQVAQGGKYSTASREADVADAEASVRIAQTNIQLSVGNLTSNAVRAQDVAQAREAVAQTAAQVVASSAQVQKTFIRTPISGTVLQLATQQGETLAAGLSAPTLIIVADLKRLEVDAYVDETDIGKVQNGQTATVTVDAYPNQVMTAKVVKVASGSTIQQGVVTYGVTLYLDPNKLILKPDMTASVTIVTGKRTAVLIVPSVAIQVSLSGNGLRVLNTKNGKQTISLVKVVVGGTDGVNTEIVSGVAEGQAIVLAGGQPTKSPPANSAFGGGGGNRGSGGGGGGRPGG